MFKRVECLVYKNTGEQPVHRLTVDRFRWRFFDPESVNFFFLAEPALQKTFHRFLKRKFVGVLFYNADQWAAYCWMTTPRTGQPPHLPSWTGKLGAYWLFYSHTRDEYRGQGLYKNALKLLINEARNREKGGSPLIYGDTDAGNIAPRHTLFTLGFRPDGVLVCYRFSLPGLLSFTLGRWHRDRAHPPLQPGVAG